MTEALWFNGWEPLERILVVGIISYAALLLLLRISGKRTLSRMTSYDFVITMALGSILAKILLASENSLSESLAAMALLIGLQYLVSISVRRWPALGHAIAGEPTVLAQHGKFIESALKRERVSREEVCCAINEKGIRDIKDTEAVILGTNGQLCVLPSSTNQQSGKIAPETP